MHREIKAVLIRHVSVLCEHNVELFMVNTVVHKINFEF